MDLALYARVLWRFKFLVIGGFLLAIGLAVLSLAKVTFAHGMPKLAYRKPLTYESTSTVLLTSPGFPWGSLAAASEAGGLSGLASFYAQLASSEAVKERLRLPPGETGGISARPVIDTTISYNAVLPMVAIEGFATSPRQAIDLSARGAQAFIGYVKDLQKRSAIRAKDRVVLQLMNPALSASVVSKRKKTLPIMIFVLVMTAALGLAFILENVRPAALVVPGDLGDDQPTTRRRPAAKPTTSRVVDQTPQALRAPERSS